MDEEEEGEWKGWDEEGEEAQEKDGREREKVMRRRTKHGNCCCVV